MGAWRVGQSSELGRLGGITRADVREIPQSRPGMEAANWFQTVYNRLNVPAFKVPLLCQVGLDKPTGPSWRPEVLPITQGDATQCLVPSSLPSLTAFDALGQYYCSTSYAPGAPRLGGNILCTQAGNKLNSAARTA